MTSRTIRQAVIHLGDRIRKGEAVNVDEALLGDRTPEEWLLEIAEAALSPDRRRLKSATRAAARSGVSAQLSIPGMEHASLPPLVWANVDGDDVALPVHRATITQIEAEIRVHRKRVIAEDRVVAGYEATAARLRELGATDDTTGLEILARYDLGGELNA